jgi:very-short-patch-repair endonuclease
MSASHHRQQLKLAAHAHSMRSAPSEPERVLWHALRAAQLGVPFRRQVVVHGFIVDFFSPAARLVIEVDGAHHARRRGADGRRDRVLEAAGSRCSGCRRSWCSASCTLPCGSSVLA